MPRFSAWVYVEEVSRLFLTFTLSVGALAVNQKYLLTRSFASILAAVACVVCVSDAAAQISWQPVTMLGAAQQNEAVQAERPRLASDNLGHVVAVYSTSPNGINDPAPGEVGIWAATSSTNGTTWSKVSTPLLVSNTARWPDVASDGAVNWLVTCEDGLPGNNTLPVLRSINYGLSWAQVGNAASAFSGTLTSNTLVNIASNNRGTWVAVWRGNDSVTTSETLAIAKSTDAGATWQQVAKMPNAYYNAHPAVHGGPGGFLVAAEFNAAAGQSDASEVGFIKLSSNADVVTTGILNTDAALDDYTEFSPRIAQNDSGTWIVSWGRINSQQQQVVTSISADGESWSDPKPAVDKSAVTFQSNAFVDPVVATGADGRALIMYSRQLQTPLVSRTVLFTLQDSLLDVQPLPAKVVDLDWDKQPGKFFVWPDVLQVPGGRWVAMWQRQNGQNGSGSLPWFTYGLESGVTAGDVATTTDLHVAKSAYADPAGPGDLAGFVITVTNNGTSESANLVEVVDDMPAGLDFEHAVVSQGTWAVASYSGFTRLVGSLGSLAPGEKANMAIAARLNAPVGTTLTNSVEVDFLGPDSDPTNDTAIASITVGTSTALPTPPGGTPTPTPTPPVGPTPTPTPTPPGGGETSGTVTFTVSGLKVKGKEPKPGKPAKPYSVKAKAVVANTGTVATSALTLEVYLSSDANLDGSDTLINGKLLKPIKAGKTSKASISVKTPGNPAGLYLLVVVPGAPVVPLAL